MILCEWDAPEGHPGQSCVHLYARVVSYRRLLPQFQFSLSGVTLVYLSRWLSATSDTGRKSCRVKSLYMERFWSRAMSLLLGS
jgi:hypothetical protein